MVRKHGEEGNRGDPCELTVALSQVADDFRKGAEEELKKLSKNLSNSASKELQATTQDLTILKEEFSNSKQELAETPSSLIESLHKAEIRFGV